MRRFILAGLLALALVACDEDKDGRGGRSGRGPASPIPEPAAALLFAAGLGVVGWRIRRR